MAISKPKISSLVSSQLPEFIQEDYSTFVAFLEAYYEYLETQTITDFDEISDIDTTLDSFVKYFKNELAVNFPSTLVDDRFLLPKLKELYVSKGSEASYKLLFKILFNKDVDVKYPATQILKTSDGKWIQPISFFGIISSGNPEDVVGQYVEIISTAENISRKILVFVDSVQETSTAGIYEFFILTNFYGNFDVGDAIKYSTIFAGHVVSTTSSLSIIQGGKNFKIGQTYTITSGASSIVIKVTSIDVAGAIKTAKITTFGINYTNSFTTNILATSNQSNNIQNFFTISGTSPSYSSTILDSIEQLSDEGYLSKYDYASTAIDGSYVNTAYAGTILTTFSNFPISNTILPTDYAVVSVQLGAIARYPGYYKNNDGFLDDTIYIQDSKYYQAFSYAIQIDELFDSYKSIVKNILHPAGTEIFGEYTINNTLDANIIGLSVLEYSFNLVTENLDQLITESGDVLIAIV